MTFSHRTKNVWLQLRGTISRLEGRVKISAELGYNKLGRARTFSASISALFWKFRLSFTVCFPKKQV